MTAQQEGSPTEIFSFANVVLGLTMPPATLLPPADPHSHTRGLLPGCLGSGRTGWCLEQLLALLPAGSGCHHLGIHLLPSPLSQAGRCKGNKKGSSMFLKQGLPPVSVPASLLGGEGLSQHFQVTGRTQRAHRAQCLWQQLCGPGTSLISAQSPQLGQHRAQGWALPAHLDHPGAPCPGHLSTPVHLQGLLPSCNA